MIGISPKQAAAERAAELVEPGMRLGLGTGSTAFFFVEALGRRVAGGLDVVAVPTSRATHDQAAALGIRLATLDEQTSLDLTVDGADEIGPGLSLIKGGGGALLREKLVAAASGRVVVIADEAKYVAELGRFPLPVEIVPFGAETTLRRIGGVLREAGYSAVPAIRQSGRTPFVTDNGNLIVDLALGQIASPETLADDLKAILGVVEHGLFIGLASRALIGTASGVMEVDASEPCGPRGDGDP